MKQLLTITLMAGLLSGCAGWTTSDYVKAAGTVVVIGLIANGGGSDSGSGCVPRGDGTMVGDITCR